MMPSLGNLDATKNLKGSTTPVDATSLPGILPGVPRDGINLTDYKVRYQKLNMDDPGDLIELESIETKAIQNRGVYVLSKKDFFFMDKIFMLISYLEEDIETRASRENKANSVGSIK